MIKIEKSQIVSAVEFGTSKISVIIGQYDKVGMVKVLGFAHHPSEGSVCKGEIVDMPKAVNIFNNVLSKAEDIANTEWDSENVYIAVTGSHINSVAGSGTVVIENPEQRVENKHIHDAFQIASIISNLDHDRIKINSIAGHFFIDDRICKTPLDQIACKLEVNSHIVTGSRARIENMLSPLKDAHVNNPQPVFSGLASAMVAINDKEQEKGVLFIDIGAGTTEYLLLYEQGIYSSGTIAIGIDHIINDIAIAFQISFNEGITVYDAVTKNSIEANSYIEVKNEFEKKSLHSRKIQADTVFTIMKLRLDELFEIVKKKSKIQTDQKNSAALVVITGGGALLDITLECANSIFKIPIRINKQNNLNKFANYDQELLSPRFTLIAGLLEHGLKHSNKSSVIQNLDRDITMMLSKVIKKVKTVLKM